MALETLDAIQELKFIAILKVIAKLIYDNNWIYGYYIFYDDPKLIAGRPVLFRITILLF